MAAGLRDIKIRFSGDTSGLDKAAASGEKQIGKWQRGFQKFNKVAVPAALAVGAAAVAVGKDSVELSRKIEDMDAKAQAVFKGQLGSVSKWADANKKALGLSRRETVGLAANFADLLVPMGFTAKEAANMSTETLDLSGALAKWSGGQYEAAEVSEILAKAMLGERDQLKSLGISISEADVQTRLAKKGQDKLKGAALQQAKALATQELIMEKSTDAQAAWANGGRKAAESQNGMNSSIQEIRESLAVALTPAIEKVTELLSKLAGWAAKNQKVVAILGIALVSLAGFVFAVNAAVKVGNAVTAVSTALKRKNAVATALQTGATKKATIAQRLMNLAMRMNPIGIVITILMALVGVIILAWKKNETFRKIVIAVWNAIKKAVKGVVDWVVNTAWPWLKRMWNNISDAAGRMRDRVVDIWNGIKDTISGAVDGIKGFLSGMWDGMVSGAKSAVNGAISIINGAIGGLNSLIGGINKVPGVNIPNIPSIPMLAEGGIVTRPTLALIGEAGPEAVVPLDKAGQHGIGGGGITVEHLEVKAFSDRFSLRQVQDELAMHGVA